MGEVEVRGQHYQIGFRDTKHMGVVVFWQKPPIITPPFLLFFGFIQLLYFSALVNVIYIECFSA